MKIKIQSNLLVLIFIIIFFYPNTISQVNSETNNIPADLPLRIQEKSKSLLELKEKLLEKEGQLIILESRIGHWRFSPPYEKYLKVEEHNQVLSQKVTEYIEYRNKLIMMIKNYYKETPSWIIKYDLKNSLIDKSKEKIPEKIPLNIEEKIIKFIEIKNEEPKISSKLSRYYLLKAQERVATEITNDQKRAETYRKHAEALNVNSEIESVKINKIEYENKVKQERDSLNRLINEKYGEVPIWVEKIIRIKELTKILSDIENNKSVDVKIEDNIEE